MTLPDAEDFLREIATLEEVNFMLRQDLKDAENTIYDLEERVAKLEDELDYLRSELRNA